MKVGIVVPYSWSFWGAVVEHAELQAAALEARGHDVRLLMGNDPPGQFTRALHPRVGRHGDPPANVIPVGRSVIVPANGSLPNIVLSPRSFFRIRRALERYGMFNLGGRVRADAAKALVAEVLPILHTAAFTHARFCFRKSAEGLAPDHPALAQLDTVNHTICADQIPGSMPADRH